MLIKVICLFKNYRRYKDWEKGNTANSICCWFSLTIIWKDQFFFIFDFYSHNKTGFHDTSGNMVLQKCSTISSVNNYIKSFYENSVSFENQYDLQYVSEKKMEACKAGVLNIPIYKRKASYNRSYQAKQIQTEAFAKSKKKKRLKSDLLSAKQDNTSRFEKAVLI